MQAVTFTYEKKFNLDVPYGLHLYWNYLRRHPERVSKRQQGGASVMSWGEICYKGAISVNGMTVNMYSQYYCDVLYEVLIPG